jgi:hypothetical protein
VYIAEPRQAPTLNLSTLNIVTDIFWTSPINLATNTKSSTENLFDPTLELLRERLESHGTSDFDNLIQGDRLAMLDILFLLAVPRGLFQSFDDE